MPGLRGIAVGKDMNRRDHETVVLSHSQAVSMYLNPSPSCQLAAGLAELCERVMRKACLKRLQELGMTLNMNSGVRGYHIYRIYWHNTQIGEKLKAERELHNLHDRYAVAVKKGNVTVGHIPREISKLCCLFLRKNSTISATVTGTRCRSPIVQGGLEIPCGFRFRGSRKIVKKMKQEMKNYL